MTVDEVNVCAASTHIAAFVFAMLTVGADGAEDTIPVSVLVGLIHPFKDAVTVRLPLLLDAPEVTVTLFVVEATGIDQPVPVTDQV